MRPGRDVGPQPDTSTAVPQLETGTPAMPPRQKLGPMGRGCGPQVRLVKVRLVSALGEFGWYICSYFIRLKPSPRPRETCC